MAKPPCTYVLTQHRGQEPDGCSCNADWGFFLHRTKEDVKTCGTCGHRFAAELLLPKGEAGGGGAELWMEGDT